MAVGTVRSGPDYYFDEEFGVSIAKLLGMLRHSFSMDMAFIGKFEHGTRTMVFVESDNNTVLPSENFCFSHPQSQTYCRKIADGELPSIIPDARSNAITRAMDVTNELSIGAYLGVPIYLSDGEIYGTLCCLKHSSDPSLETRDPSLLAFVADVIADRVEFHRHRQQHDNEIRARIEGLSSSEELTMHFQPIWSLTGAAICGYEALARFNTEPYRSPDIWFSEAEQVGLGDFLETLAIDLALTQLPKIPESCFLSINASPAAILSGAVGNLLNRKDAQRIVLEVTEHSQILDYPEFRDSVQSIRKMGARLAIDDAGSGYASLQHVLELDADVIKLDLNLIRNIHCNQKKQALAAALVSYAQRVRAQVVAEGVETQEEFDVLKELGVDKVQGYYIGKPAELA
ncbi:EAL domain-containing protein [uncultured Marinobacter sp.]|uniref:sensor domain-containing phosphodiesterase n=1 Tax=uncultured Marinobacter sp. TaxID=187379 RepID=UPI0030DDBBB0|tara:strand:- start:501 stop:1703 length:1203 start_codon:yes stop_codon:yes gene_type:complete